MNFWLANDLCPKHEGESKYGAEKILQIAHRRYGMDCSNANDAEYLQMAMSKVAGNGVVDKVQGLLESGVDKSEKGRFWCGGIHPKSSTI